MIKHFFLKRSVVKALKMQQQIVLPKLHNDMTVLLLSLDLTIEQCESLVSGARQVFHSDSVTLVNITRHKLPKEQKEIGLWLPKKAVGYFGKLPTEFITRLNQVHFSLIVYTGESTDVYGNLVALSVPGGFRVSLAENDDPVFQLQLHDGTHAPVLSRLEQLAHYLKLLSGKA